MELQASRIAIVGANGSGKSTFARLLNGLLLPSDGYVTVDGFDTRMHTQRVRRLVGFVFQNPDLQFVFPTVEEDLSFGLKNLRLDKIEIARRIDQTLEYFGLEHARNQSVHTLSGGEKQLLCIAAVLVMNPQTIVFDEPTTLLDLSNSLLVNRTIFSLTQQCIVVTHDLNFAERCDQAVWLDQGRIAAQGDGATVARRYRASVHCANEASYLPEKR